MNRFYVLCLVFIFILAGLAGLQYWLDQPEPVAAIATIEGSKEDTVFEELASLIAEPAPTIEPQPQPEAGTESETIIEIKTGREENQEIDFLKPINFEEVPPELKEVIRSVYVEYYRGNYEYAAMIALDALEMSEDYPKIQLIMHTGAGIGYEKIGYIGMAIEQYQQALAIFPEHRHSYNAMRRLDPAFAASHPELPKPQPKKPATAAKPVTTAQ